MTEHQRTYLCCADEFSFVPLADFLGKLSQAAIKNANGDVIGSKLTITNAAYENTGSYECRVTNTHGEDKSLAMVNVEKVIDFGSGADEPL